MALSNRLVEKSKTTPNPFHVSDNSQTFFRASIKTTLSAHKPLDLLFHFPNLVVYNTQQIKKIGPVDAQKDGVVKVSVRSVRGKGLQQPQRRRQGLGAHRQVIWDDGAKNFKNPPTCFNRLFMA